VDEGGDVRRHTSEDLLPLRRREPVRDIIDFVDSDQFRYDDIPLVGSVGLRVSDSHGPHEIANWLSACVANPPLAADHCRCLSRPQRQCGRRPTIFVCPPADPLLTPPARRRTSARADDAPAARSAARR
jgi:hypothetical protein